MGRIDPQGLFSISKLLSFGGSGSSSKKQGAGCTCGGPRLNIGGGLSATGFLAIFGVSVGGGGNLSIPTDSLPFVGDGSFRGTEASVSGSITPMLGIGAFLGAGPNYSGGYSHSALPQGFSGSATPVVQFGVGDGAGIEVSSDIADITESYNAGGSGGRIAGGAYGGFGMRFSGAHSSGPMGCR